MTLMIQALTMSYTHPSNTGTNENERDNLSFSFSDKSKTVTTDELGQKVKMSLQNILNNRFDHYEKRTIDPKHGRLNFACPYCGDSYHDVHKKRGNIYTDKGFYFKCYNCGKYRSILGFLRDFKVEVSADEIVLAKELQKNAPAMIRNVDPMVFLDHTNLVKYAIEREDIEKKYKLVPLDRSKIYICKRGYNLI